MTLEDDEQEQGQQQPAALLSLEASIEARLDNNDLSNMSRTFPDTFSNATTPRNNVTTSIYVYDDPMAAAAKMMFQNDGGGGGGKMLPQVRPPASWHEPYHTTITLIVVMHLLFWYQWNTRKTRSQVLVSYRTLIQKKQYHRGLLAVLSHPPIHPTSLTRRQQQLPGSTLAIPMGNSEDAPGRLRRYFIILLEFFHPLTHGHLSGLPLLTYNSHLLWTCRALEPLSSSSWHYARILVALSVVAWGMELRMTHNVLRTLATHSAATRARHIMLHRTMGTLTMLTSALLLLYRFAFPHIPLAILPFSVSHGDDDHEYGRLVGWPSLSYGMCLVLLTSLSWNRHAFTSVLFGSLSANLWMVGITSFLGTRYWGTAIVLWVVGCSLLSLRATPDLAAWVMPCVDYVAWDAQGRIPNRDNGGGQRRDSDVTPGPTPDDNHDDDDDDDAGDDTDNEEERLESGGEPLERRPLLRHTDDINIRGRLPIITDMDDDLDVPQTSNNDPLFGLSQRRGVGPNPEMDAARQ